MGRVSVCLEQRVWYLIDVIIRFGEVSLGTYEVLPVTICSPSLSSMLEHHVYFWLKEDKCNEDCMAEFRKALERLIGIPGVVRGLVGVPAPVKPRPVVDISYQFGLSLAFESIGDHDAYQSSLEHVKFLETYRSWWKEVKIFDLA